MFFSNVSFTSQLEEITLLKITQERVHFGNRKQLDKSYNNHFSTMMQNAVISF